MEMYEKKIERLNGGFSSVQETKTSDPTAGLSNSLADLNLKGVKN